MGYREWRERTLARIDETADRLEEKAAQSEADLDFRRERAEDEARSAWMHRRAIQLGEDHDDLARRAEKVGMELPVPERRQRGAVPLSIGALVTMADVAGDGGRSIDRYEAWRDRLVLEERFAAKVERGEQLTLIDRAALRIARRAAK